MGKVTFDISMSLDGFITGPNESVDRLHEWLYGLASWREPHDLEGGEANRDSDVLAEAFKATGAFVMGRGLFDVGEEPWGDNPPFHMHVFVVTHNARETLVKEGGTTFTFVIDGVESALNQARAAAGNKDVMVVGGADIIQQLISAGLVDEFQIHLVPVLLGDGIRLFDHLSTGPIELESTRVVASPSVTHLKFRIAK
jgi:dihydrofolate reductase